MELAQIDMIYSLLSMLNMDDKEHISRTLLGMSTCRESCIAMRQAGCMSLLVQLIHGCPENAAARNLSNAPSLSNGAGSRGARQRAAAALHNLVHCLPDEKWRRREARVLRLLEIVREYSFNQQQRIQAASNAEAAGISAAPSAPVDTSRVGPAIAALMKLSFDEDHRHAITVLGGLQAVSELLVVDLEMFPISSAMRTPSLSINIRRFGCMTLTNLTFGDVTNKALLCSMPTTLKAVVGLLGFLENEDIVQAAGSVLRNLSWSADPPSKTALREAGAVKQLVRSVMTVKREATRTAVFSALWNVSAHLSDNKADICQTEGALDFIAFALNLPGSIGESAGGVLRNISSHIAMNNEYRQILRRRGCLEVLVNQLKSSNLTTVSNACGALWNLSAKCPEDQQTLWELGAVHNLQALTTSKHQMIATAATSAIRNLQAYKQQCQSGVSADQYIKQSLNRTTSESGDAPNAPLSSSFPGPGRNTAPQPAQQPASVAPGVIASSSFSSPFATGQPLASSGFKGQMPLQPTAANMLGLLGPGGQNKNAILYSDTPNSNVVHLNYLHMLASRGQPSSQFQPPLPPHSVMQQAKENQVTSVPTQQKHLPDQIPVSYSPSQSSLKISANSTNGKLPSSLPLGASPFSAPAVSKPEVDDEEDEQPTNFGQRFQDEETDSNNGISTGSTAPLTQHHFPATTLAVNQMGAGGSLKNNLSPTGSSTSSHNNENKMTEMPGTSSSVIKPLSNSNKMIHEGVKLPVKLPHQHQPHVTFEQTPMMFSLRSSVDSLNSVEVPSIRSEAVSEYSRLASGVISPTELPESPGAAAEEQHVRQLRQQHQTGASVFRMPAPPSASGGSVFVTPQPIAKPKIHATPSAPLASAEESFPNVDSYADESDRPVVYATEDTPAILSHATSLSNLTTPGFETPGGAFSPVRAVGTERPISPPTAANMRLLFRKPVEPEPVEDEVFPYYTEDTPCHLSASSSLSSLSVMSHASSRRSATNTPLRQKVFALQTGAIAPAASSAFNIPGTGGSVLHPRVLAAAARHADPYLRPFMPTSQASPFATASPSTRPKPTAVLLEESEDSHNISGLSQDQAGTRDISLHEDEIEQHHDHHDSDEEDHHIVQRKQEISEDEVDDDEESEETEDIIQQLIETALDTSKTIDSSSNRQQQPIKTSDFLDPMSALSNQIANVRISEPPAEDVDDALVTDLDEEPTAKELEMLEECINCVLTPEKESNKLLTATIKAPNVDTTSQSNNSSPQSKFAKRNSLTVVSGKLRSPQKSATSSDTGSDTQNSRHPHQYLKGNASYRRKSSAVKLSSAETSPLAAIDAHRSISPGSASRGGSSSGGGSTARQLVSKKLQPPAAKRSPTALPANSAKRNSVSQHRRSRSRGEEQLTSPTSAQAPLSGPSSTSKLSPSSSSTTSMSSAVNNHNKQQNAQAATNASGTSQNTKRWNFSTKPNLVAPSDSTQPAGKTCKHQHGTSESKQDEMGRPSSSSNTVWQKPQTVQHRKNTTSSTASTAPGAGENSNPAKDLAQSSTNDQEAGNSSATSQGKSRRLLMTTV